ncbi:MAG: TonB-dependent receptor, partial [Burkholderiales bacterium]|nr:TonB-dependent receptor [Phycisphaerae bacterium]
DIFAYTDSRSGIAVGQPVRHASENELFTRAIAVWTPNDAHSLAFGTEYSHTWFKDPPQSDALDRLPIVEDRTWETNTISFLVEEQWKINDQLTLFLSFRTDKNDFSDWLISPRGTLVYTPTNEDTFKVMVGQSVRRGDDEELYGEYERSGTIPEPETLRSYELSYDRKLSSDWNVGVRGFYEDYDAIGWIPSLYQSASLGQFQIAGGEIELTYSTRSTRITLSESVSTLVDASVPEGAAPAGQGLSSSPYGYGGELANWAPSITKLALIHDLSRQWTISSSVILYSGFPGGQDYSEYAASLATTPQAVPLSDAGYDTPYGPNLYVNFGLEYRPTEHCTIRLDGYNLAALVDDSLSKRNYILRTSEYSDEPAAVAISVSYSF